MSRRAGAPSPASFPGGEDSVWKYLRQCPDSGDDPVTGEPSAGEPRAASSRTISVPAFAGHLDPVVFVRGQPELLSSLTDPE